MDITLRYTLVASFVIHILVLKFAFLPSQKNIMRVVFPIEVVRIHETSEVEEEEGAVTPIKEIVKEKEGKKKPKEKEEFSKTDKSMSAKPLTDLKCLIDTSKFRYQYYLRQIRSIIDSNWDYSKVSDSLRAMVYFRILPDGSIIKLKIEESSGNKIFDFLAKRAVELSDGLPPLPPGYREKYLGVYIEFVYRE
jgi:TonB family protein